MKELCKSHIVPKSFFVSMRDNPNDLIQVSVRLPGKTVKRKIGIYDTNLLCQQCERKTSSIDDYGKEVFLDMACSVIHGNERSGCQYEIENVDIIRLKQFLIAVLWRAAVSQRPEFESVKLEKKVRQKAKKIVFEEVTPKHSEFPFLIIKYLPSDFGPVIVNPTSFVFERCRWAKLFFPGYCVWMYVGRRAPPVIFRKIISYSSSTLYLFGMKYTTSSTFKSAMNVVAGKDTY